MKLLDIKEVKKLTKLSENTIRRLIKQRKFPSPVNVGVKVNRWREEDIKKWMKNLKNKKTFHSQIIVIFYQK